ncbi:MAG: hypothetical protein GF313_16115 [Caldithrix sp.]|nr:hypothetical protein [Caldithrix sp.]
MKNKGRITFLDSFKKQYLKIMMFFVRRGLQKASLYDVPLQNEIARLPTDYSITLTIHPNGPAMRLYINARKQMVKLNNQHSEHSPGHLLITIKHVQAAWYLFTFRERTAEAFARNRMTVAGDLSHAIAFVRCLNIIECGLLPRILAHKAVKRCAGIHEPIYRRLGHSLKLYRKIIFGY